MARSIISSRVELNLYIMCGSEVPIPVWIRPRFAYFNASAATSISFCTARVRAQIVGHVTAFDISTTLLKSPGLEIGNPASITSTPNASSAFATCIFSTVFSWQPGTCSPSRSVVSKINNLSDISFYLFIMFVFILNFPQTKNLSHPEVRKVSFHIANRLKTHTRAHFLFRLQSRIIIPKMCNRLFCIIVSFFFV